jgi:hypothetical protein
MTTIRIYQEDGSFIDRLPTPEEIELNIKDNQEITAKYAKAQELQDKKQALLDKLGITEEEARLLLQ